MQAIITKFLAPSNTRGSRIKAISHSGTKTVEYNHELNSEENHLAAAKAILAPISLDVGRELVIVASGVLPSGEHTHILK